MVEPLFNRVDLAEELPSSRPNQTNGRLGKANLTLTAEQVKWAALIASTTGIDDVAVGARVSDGIQGCSVRNQESGGGNDTPRIATWACRSAARSGRRGLRPALSMWGRTCGVTRRRFEIYEVEVPEPEVTAIRGRTGLPQPAYT